MECHYHPGRESTDNCAICGKSICKECGLEIAGKIYCKECLESIVGVSLDNKAGQAAPQNEPLRSEPARLNRQPNDSIYAPQSQPEYVPQANQQPDPNHEIKQIIEDSPYNVNDNIDYAGLKSSYLEENNFNPEPQITQTQINDPIFPDHSHETQQKTSGLELEDKYEKYLDDLYFEEDEIPLNEQLAKDEEQYGSLTRRPYPPREEPAQKQTLGRQTPPKKQETPEEMEARLRAEIMAGKKGDISEGNIHNLQYKDEKEKMSTVDILLTIILVIVILVVIYYLVYIFILNTYYPTFTDALYGLTDPQSLINNILAPQK